jgi:hypothetical protein
MLNDGRDHMVAFTNMIGRIRISRYCHTIIEGNPCPCRCGINMMITRAVGGEWVQMVEGVNGARIKKTTFHSGRWPYKCPIFIDFRGLYP